MPGVSTELDGLPIAPPPRPKGPPAPRPGSVAFDVSKGGLLRLFPDSEDETNRAVLVMIGNPRIHRPEHMEGTTVVEALTIKANTLVAWVDRRGVQDLQGFESLSGEAAPKDGVALEPSASVIPQFLLGIYAEGAVKLSFGDFTMRAEKLYLDPNQYKALIIEPDFDGRAVGLDNEQEPLPLHVRARRGRLIAKGLSFFEDAEVTSSRAEDRIELRVADLSVREYEEEETDAEGKEKPHFLGYKSSSSQWYSGRTITGRGERVPLFWLPAAEFGASEYTEALVNPVKGFRTGSQSNLGRFAFLRLGWPIGDRKDPLVNAFIEFGGYTDRGPGIGAALAWDHRHPGDSVKGYGGVTFFGVYDFDGNDRRGFRAGEGWRYRVTHEARTFLMDKELYLDTEFNDFSDRGFNNEFFERDDLNHKDRESYGRLRWAPKRPGNFVATLDGKWHQRNFFTETVQLPEVGAWVFPVGLITPRRRGGFAADVTSENRAGYLKRAFDSAVTMMDYEAWRFYTDTRLNAEVDVGDLRMSGYVGGLGTIYEGRTDGGTDLTQAAMLAGFRTNLQMHRTYGAAGTWFQLNGLRHVIDMDGEFQGRFFDAYPNDRVPFFDYREQERERSAFIFRLRNRLETRRETKPRSSQPTIAGVTAEPPAPSRSLRTVADLEVVVKKYVADRGPWLHDSPGAVQLSLFGQPRESINIAGEMLIDWGTGIQTASLGSGLRTTLNDKPFSLFTGIRSVKSRSFSITADLAWRFSEKYGLRLLEVFDWKEGENLTRILFRRYSPDHIIVFGVSVRNQDDIGIEFSIEPAIGGRTTEGPEAFKDEPDPNPWGAFRR